MKNYKEQIKVLESCINKLRDSGNFFVDKVSLRRLYDQTHYEVQSLEYLIYEIEEDEEGISNEFLERIKTNANSYLKIAKAYKQINQIAQ